MISPSRVVAFDVLRRVEEGGYASDLLAELSASLDSRDAGLASEIVYGSLRVQAQLDSTVQHFGGQDPARLEVPVRVALRMGAYQLRYMDRVPAHAAVGESVELVKCARLGRAAGLVNAVLRKITREAIVWPDRATEFSMPEWLLAGWERQYGRELAECIALTVLRPPTTWVRNPPEGSGLELESGDVPGSYRVVRGDARGLRIQDVGSQSVVPLLDLRTGQRLLDVCAAPGNKTAQALESGIEAIACDRSLHRLRAVEGCARVVLDATQGLPFRGSFDRILVDAPCSGTGTLARNPEIRWRLTPADIRELHGRQTQILRNALELLAPDGKLVYSTCSLEKKENEDVVDRVLKRLDGRYRIERTLHRIPGRDPGDGFFAAVITGYSAPRDDCEARSPFAIER